HRLLQTRPDPHTGAGGQRGRRPAPAGRQAEEPPDRHPHPPPRHLRRRRHAGSHLRRAGADRPGSVLPPDGPAAGRLRQSRTRSVGEWLPVLIPPRAGAEPNWYCRSSMLLLPRPTTLRFRTLLSPKTETRPSIAGFRGSPAFRPDLSETACGSIFRE